MTAAINRAAIPARLQIGRTWVVFALVPQPNGDKPKKVPYIPGTDQRARPNDPRTWRTCDEAFADFARTGRAPATVLTPTSGLTLVDIDGQTTHPLVDAIDSYAEKSLNDGLHIVAEGRPPMGFTRPPGVEVYPRDGNRFVILTGNIIGGRGAIQERTETLAHLFPPRPEPQPIRVDPRFGEPDDAEAVERVLLMPAGRRLYRDGDPSGYPSGSEADIALCNCFVAAGVTDPGRFDALFRGSALYPARQERWDDRRYRERTIAKALDGTVQPWEGWRRSVEPPAPAAASPDPQILPITDCCDERVAELERQLAEARAVIAAQVETIAALRAVASASTRILGNKSLGPQRVIAAALATQFVWRATAGETPPGEAETPPPPGMMRVGVAELARLAGVSEKSAGEHLKALAEQGLIQRKLERRADRVDRTTGEIYDEPKFVTAHFVGPSRIRALTPTAAAAFASNIADFTAERIERRGGKRTSRCPDHPDADVVREYVDRCAECRRELASGTAVLPDAMLDPPAEASSANFADHSPSVDSVPLSRIFSDHDAHEPEGGQSANFADQIDDRLARARADLQARSPSRAPVPAAPPLPGFDPPPVDRYTA